MHEVMNPRYQKEKKKKAKTNKQNAMYVWLQKCKVEENHRKVKKSLFLRDSLSVGQLKHMPISYVPLFKSPDQKHCYINNELLFDHIVL